MLIFRIALVVSIMLVGSGWAQERGIFEPVSDNLVVPLGLESIEFGDLNGDGVPDLVASTGSEVNVRLGLGSGVFATTGQVISTGATPRFVRLVDLDNDGDLDIAVGIDKAGNSCIETRLNTGGVFPASGPGVSIPVTNTRYPAFGDVNGDSIPDLAVPLVGAVRIHLGTSAGVFVSPAAQVVPASASGFGTVLLEDVDGDGDRDLLSAAPFVGSGAGDTVSIRLNNGSGVFGAGQDVVVGSGVYQFHLADLNGDGISDLVTGDEADDTVSVRFGLAGGLFGLPGSTTAVATGAHNVVVGDVDGDGALDVVTSGVVESGCGTLFGDGAGGFTLGETFVLSPYNPLASLSLALELELHDVDLDGDLDLGCAFSSGFGPSVLVFRNEFAGFRRGDSNLDGSVNLSDPIELLGTLFSQGAPLLCVDAADANDDDTVNLADPIALIYAIFGAGPPIPQPFGPCGFDNTPDSLPCDVRYSCP
ncbi:MAG: VCBS repeat-containing protein [Planctomycetota bacterium]